MANKIKYGLKNVYYAPATIGDDNSATYEAPVPWPGAVNLSLSAEGETTPFYADNIAYYTASSNNGYSGDLESALVPDSFRTKVLGEVKGGNGLTYESANAEPVHFALLFEFNGDKEATRHVIYNCVATRPDVAGSTKEGTITPQTESVSLTASTIYVPALSDDIVKARAGASDAAYTDFFKSVVTPTKTS